MATKKTSVLDQLYAAGRKSPSTPSVTTPTSANRVTTTVKNTSTASPYVDTDPRKVSAVAGTGVSTNVFGNGFDADNAPRNKAEALLVQQNTAAQSVPKAQSYSSSSSSKKAVTNEKKTTTKSSGGGGGGYSSAPAVAPTFYLDTTSMENEYRKMIEDAQAAQIEAQRAAVAEGVAGYEAQRAALADQYARSAQDIYRNARLAAIGNNEVLAAQGLAGNLYANPMSGYSETSRIAQDNALRTNLAQNAIAQKEAEDEVNMAISQLQADGKREEAQIIAQNKQYMIDVMLALKQMQISAMT